MDFYGAIASAATTAYPRFAFGGTAPVSALLGSVTENTSATTTANGVLTAANSLHTGVSLGTAATVFAVQAHATLTVTGVGTLGVRWAGSATTTQTLKSGSYVTLTRIS